MMQKLLDDSYTMEEPPMIDMIFVVEDDLVVRWHEENIQRNPSHYGAIPRLLRRRVRFKGAKNLCPNILQHSGPHSRAIC